MKTLSLTLIILLVLFIGLLIFLFLRKGASENKETVIPAIKINKTETKIKIDKQIENKIENKDRIAVYYINLDQRKDRRNQIEKNFLPLLRLPGIIKRQRIQAVKNSDNGAMGCSLSHIKALKTFENDPTKPQVALILEDDAQWLKGRSHNEQIENLLKDTSWSVCLLSCNGKAKRKNNLTSFANQCLTASAYLVRLNYAPTLRSFWEEAHKRKPFQPIDVTWFELMKNDPDQWVLSRPKLVKQRASYSDIQKGYVDYGV